MMLLYAIMAGVGDFSSATLLESIEKCTELFEGMSQITVARRCADITRDLLRTAKTSILLRESSGTSTADALQVPSVGDGLPLGGDPQQGDPLSDFMSGDFLGDLIGVEDIFAGWPESRDGHV